MGPSDILKTMGPGFYLIKANRNRSFVMVQRHAPLDICDAISAEKIWRLVLTHGYVGEVV